MGRTRKYTDQMQLTSKSKEVTIKRNLSVRIPKALDKQLFQYVIEHDLSLSGLMIAMIKNYFEIKPDGFIPIEAIKEIKKPSNEQKPLDKQEKDDFRLKVAQLVKKIKQEDLEVNLHFEKWLSKINSLENNHSTDKEELILITRDLLSIIKINHMGHLVDIYETLL